VHPSLRFYAYIAYIWPKKADFIGGVEGRIRKNRQERSLKQPFLNGWVAGDARAAAILGGFFLRIESK
jgi:hypothetical protein